MKDVILPSYDEESAPLVVRDRDYRPAGLGNVVESRLESTQQFTEGSTPRTSNISTMMHLLKGNIGTGILAMPNAISNAGLLVGSVGIPILGVLCVHCMHLLVINSKSLSRRLGVPSLDYAGTAENAFLAGPEKVRRFAPWARNAVNGMLMLTQFGFCCVYFLFVSKSIYEVVNSLHGSSPFSITGYMAMLFPLMVVFNFIRSLKNITPASSVANVLQSVGLIIVFYYLLKGPHSTSLNVYTAPIEKLPLYFGTAMYAFEGIGVVLPLENAMATPDDFGGLNGVLNTGMVIVASLYTGVGFYGYLKYGDLVKSSITFNLPAGITSEVVRLMFAVAIFLSYALQLYVPFQILWPFVKTKCNLQRFSQKEQLIMEYIFRTILVSITFAMAAVIPMLHLFIALVGAMASSSLALIFPPIIEMVMVWESGIGRGKLRLITMKNILLILFGLTGSIIGTVMAIREIVRCSQNPSDPTCSV